MYQDDEWPEILEEREPINEVERLDERFGRQGIAVKRVMEGHIKAEISPGHRIQLHWREMELEMHEGGVASILVNGMPVWTGEAGEIEEVATYSSSIDKTLCGVAVNGKFVWVR